MSFAVVWKSRLAGFRSVQTVPQDGPTHLGTARSEKHSSRVFWTFLGIWRRMASPNSRKLKGK